MSSFLKILVCYCAIYIYIYIYKHIHSLLSIGIEDDDVEYYNTIQYNTIQYNIT